MLGDKLDIYKSEWIEVIFSHRNRSYGAYTLRKENSKTLTRALFWASLVFVLLLSASTIYKIITGFVPKDQDKFIQTDVELTPPPVDKKAPPPPPPPPAEAPPAKVEQIKFPPPVVKPDEEVKEELPSIGELMEQKNQDGDPNANFSLQDQAPQQEVEKVVEEEKVIDVAFVEQNPEFPGGQEGFARHLQNNLKYPPIAKENNIQGRVFVSFVVEKDGNLTDIKVERGIGGGCDEEAVRVLKLTKGWKPGVQNGRPVRVKYILPILFQLDEE